MRWLAACLLLAPFAPAQDIEADLQVLRERNREILHPRTDPLVLVGREQDGNGFRDRVPALVEASKPPVMVDADELYARRRAIYEKGAKYHQPLPRSDSASPGGSRQEDAVQKSKGVTDEPDSEPGGSKLVAAGFVLLAIGAFVLRRR